LSNFAYDKMDKKLDYQKILNHPKVLILKTLVENEPSHRHEKDTWEHSKNVFFELKQILKLKFIKDQEKRKKCFGHLNQKIGRLTRKQCLLIASIVHDLGKYYTRQTNKDGFFISPGHEIKGPKQIDFLKDILSLTSKDFEFIKKISRYHMVLFPYLNEDKFKKLTPKFLAKITKNIPLEISLHTLTEIEVAQPPKIQKTLIRKLFKNTIFKILS